MIKEKFIEVCNFLSKNEKHSLIIEQIILPMRSSINFEQSKLYINDNAITLNLYSNKNSIPVIFVFWLEPSRITFFLKKDEISDDFLFSEEAILNLMHFLKIILSSEIIEQTYLNISGEIIKKAYLYTISNNKKKKEEIIDIVFRKFKGLKKTFKVVKKYEPWCSCLPEIND